MNIFNLLLIKKINLFSTLNIACTQHHYVRILGPDSAHISYSSSYGCTSLTQSCFYCYPSRFLFNPKLYQPIHHCSSFLPVCCSSILMFLHCTSGLLQLCYAYSSCRQCLYQALCSHNLASFLMLYLTISSLLHSNTRIKSEPYFH